MEFIGKMGKFDFNHWHFHIPVPIGIADQMMDVSHRKLCTPKRTYSYQLTNWFFELTNSQNELNSMFY
ncbi:MAG: hypothetical protein C0433_03265 [Cyclobacterium sp.]|nr:hypothetical protein [Cyclobacterium sp.]